MMSSGVLGCWPAKGASSEDPLDRLGYIEVRASQGREERHDAMGEEPQHEVGSVVPGAVVPDKQQP